MTFHPHLAYSASAGSGKTFALSARYISLLFMGEPPSAILAATFTNKAAAEMRQRVVATLRDFDNPKNNAFVELVSEQTGLGRAALMAQQPKILARFLNSANYIVTLDSFFVSILRSSSLELGLEPNFVTKERDPSKTQTIFLEELRANGMLHTLARLALEIEDRRFAKIIGLLHDFYVSDPLLPIARYHAQRLDVIESEIDECRRRLQDEVIASGASKSAIANFAPIETKKLASKSVFGKPSLTEHRNYKKYILTHPQIETLYQELKTLIAKWSQAKEAFVLNHLFEIYDHYRNTLIASAVRYKILGFDDLSFFTYRLLQEIEDKEFLYFKLDTRFHHILLDEFQDTSTLQFLLLKPMIDEIFAGEGQSALRSFFYVGDTKQSLYRFRGGVEELFDKVAQNYQIPITPMDTNYRSARNIVEQVNQWFGESMPGYVPQRANGLYSDAGTEIEGYVDVVEIEESVDDMPQTMIEMMIFKLQRLYDAGISWDDMAILVHTNKDGQRVRDTLYEIDIPTRLKTSSSLRNHPKIASIVAMIEYIYAGHPIDAEAMLSRIGTTLGQVDMSKYNLFMSPVQMIDALVRDMGYFDDDPNVLRLMEFASAYSDIADFIEEFASSQIELAAHTSHGVQIMTVHGSKGLEFGHVVLMDRFTRPKPDTSALLYGYDEHLYISQIMLRMAHRENFDPDYAYILDQKKAATDKDRLNLLYVATTRAVESLIIIRKPKESVFDLIGIRAGSKGNIESRPKSDQTPHPDSSHAILPDRLHYYGYDPKPPKDEMQEYDYEAILFGMALHYALEMLAKFEIEAIPSAIEAMRNKYGSRLSTPQIREIQRRISMLVGDECFLEMLDGAIISREQPISYRGEKKQIDLLLEYPDKAIVVDYKSSDKYTAHHHTQVQHYLEAIQGILDKPTAGYVIYLLPQTVRCLSVA